MFILAHAGFTLAPAAAFSGWWKKNRGFRHGAPDLRWLLAGTVLPDVVDKAVGEVLFRSYFQNGRIYFHTSLFTLLLLLAGLYGWARRRDSRLLLLSLGMASHLVLDRIWIEPTTALWPSLGPFLRHPSDLTLIQQVLEYVRDPVFWVTEAVGAVLLVTSLNALGVDSGARLGDFLRRGNMPALLSRKVTGSGNG
ncbi:MAG: metal-dependent hydrolase [Actinobacteria bacterium]|nr:metal-dependent hydrolase [Actinomycetota bacterium]